MKITTLIYYVIVFGTCIPRGTLLAQATVSSMQQSEPSAVEASSKLKRSMNPESIKRAKLTRLRKDAALTEEQIAKVKPIIDTYVTEILSTKNDSSLQPRAKRQKFSELRKLYDNDLDAVLNAEQQQKLASIKAERRSRLRNARAGSASRTIESPGSTGTSAVVQ